MIFPEEGGERQTLTSHGGWGRFYAHTQFGRGCHEMKSAIHQIIKTAEGICAFLKVNAEAKGGTGGVHEVGYNTWWG